MSQQGAPRRQQALPECLVCNWEEQEEEGEQCEHPCKGSPWAQQRLGSALIPAGSSPPVLGEFVGIISNISTTGGCREQSNWGRREQSLPRGHCRDSHSTSAAPGLKEMQAPREAGRKEQQYPRQGAALRKTPFLFYVQFTPLCLQSAVVWDGPRPHIPRGHSRGGGGVGGTYLSR